MHKPQLFQSVNQGQFVKNIIICEDFLYEYIDVINRVGIILYAFVRGFSFCAPIKLVNIN